MFLTCRNRLHRIGEEGGVKGGVCSSSSIFSFHRFLKEILSCLNILKKERLDSFFCETPGNASMDGGTLGCRLPLSHMTQTSWFNLREGEFGGVCVLVSSSCVSERGGLACVLYMACVCVYQVQVPQKRFSSKMAIRSLWKLMSMVSAIACLLRRSCSRRRAISLCWSRAFCAVEAAGGGACVWVGGA